jgi:VIT family
MAVSPSSLSASDLSDRRPFFTRYLDLTDRLSEVVFGLIMVLSFTLGAGLVVKEGQEAATQMLLSILGCNIAWGLIDGGLYLLTCVFDRSRKARLLQSIQKTANEADALAMVGRALDDRLEPLTSPAERNHLYQQILERLKNVTPERARLKKKDFYGAIASFWLVLLTAVPALLPFLVFRDRFVALRVSNLLLLATLFLVGYRCARATHNNPWIFGSILLLVGVAMVGVAMALGG